MSASQMILDSFLTGVEKLTPDIDNLYQGSKNYILDDWKAQQKAAVMASGAASTAIPGYHLVGISLDVAFVLNRMSVASLGVGAILSEKTNLGNILEQDDFPAVLGYWCHDDGIKEAMKGKGAGAAAKIGTKLGSKALTKGGIKTLLASAGYVVGQRLGGKAMAKAGAKFSGKFVGKYLGGFIPFLGPAASATINWWLISGILEASEEYYKDKIALMS